MNNEEAQAKIETVREVILKRKAVIDKARRLAPRESDRIWYDGRQTGLMDVYHLLGESLESISVELEEKK